MTDEVQQTLPAGDIPQAPNVDAGVVPASSAPEPSATAPAAVLNGDAPVSTELSNSESVAAGHGDVPNAVPAVAEPTTEAGSASNAAGAVITSLNAASSAEPMTFEQRIEQRFLQVEAFLLKLPHSIAHAFHMGSAEPEEIAKRAVAHLLDHNQ